MGRLVLMRAVLGGAVLGVLWPVAAADEPWKPLVVFPKNTSLEAEVPERVVIDGAGAGTRANWTLRRPNGGTCRMSAIFALVADRGVVIARGNALTCPESRSMRHVLGYFIDAKSGTGAFRGYCVKRDHAGDAEDWVKNPCVRAVIPARTRAHFLFKREVVL